MDTLIKADIFFFITTIAVVIVALFLVILLYYAIRFFNHVDRILYKIEERAGEVTTEVKEVLVDVRESFIFRFLFPKQRRKKQQK